MYHNLWDLTQNTMFDGSISKVNDLRSQEFGYDLYLKSSDPTHPSIPTSNGWIHPYNNTESAVIESEYFNMGSPNQFTVMFEVFPIDTEFDFYFNLYEDAIKSSRLSFEYNKYYTAIHTPETNSSTCKLNSQKWNQVRRF